jgi:hypothetical protein
VSGDGYERRLHRGDTLLVPPLPFPLTWTPLGPITLLRVEPGQAVGNANAAAVSSFQRGP